MIGVRVKTGTDEEWQRQRRQWREQHERKAHELEVRIEMLQRELAVVRANLLWFQPAGVAPEPVGPKE